MSSNAVIQPKPAPIKATWITLVIVWILFLLPIPGVGLFVGWPLNLVAFILAIVVMTRGRTAGGLIPLVCTLVASPIIYFIGLAIFGAAVGGSSYKDHVEKARAAASGVENEAAQAESAAAPETVEVTARTLFDDYEANEVAADNQYKGKRLVVSGNVAGINKDFTGAVYVELVATPFQSVHAWGLAKDAAAELSKGQSVTLECIGDGLMMALPRLKNCNVR